MAGAAFFFFFFYRTVVDADVVERRRVTELANASVACASRYAKTNLTVP